ncbi:hypothetical protein AB0M54_21215 [Actinoplanes sp. NPDC051470]|uniref:hypothetical protein n=1 Tax=Actinoplanes sp. NPDC051470 TaxID=3157224 RepID=UPI0034254E49
MSGGHGSAAEERVWARMPEGTRRALAELSGTELRTLLLGAARDRAADVTPAELMRRWRDDRFVRPAAVDPRRLAVVEARIWQLLPPEVDGVELSPVVPLGTCSAVGPVSQNRVVTTMRGTEVLSDATNALAVEAAGRRRRQPAGGSVHLAACQRHLRAQDFGEGRPAHFRLFALVSSARDAGSGTTQARLLALHLGFWQKVLAALLPDGNPRVHVSAMEGRGRAPTGEMPIVEEPGRGRGGGYYTEAALRITAGDGEREVELGDGGFTTWTSRLMNDAKERCLVSCLATERVITQDDPAGRQGG